MNKQSKSPKSLVFATNNLHKLEEVSSMMGTVIQILSLNSIGFSADIPETEPTLEGNALIKARTIYATCKTNIFADDTGLEVYALDMRPGVLSARYAGPQKVDADNISLLLKELEHHSDRRARFRTVFALILDGSEYLFEGVVEGVIALHPAGTGGFGYDPVFCPEGQSHSFAQMSPAEKNSMSHRARALQSMLDFLTQMAIL